MIDLKLDSSGDLVLEDYDLVLIDDIDQVIQNLIIRLRFFRNDWFLNIDAGIPYFEDIFTKAPNQIRVESLIKNEILQTPEIDEITSFSSSYTANNRSFTVNFSALADNNPIDIEIELP